MAKCVKVSHPTAEEEGISTFLHGGKWTVVIWNPNDRSFVRLSMDELIKFCVLTLQEVEAVVHQYDGSLKIPADLAHMANNKE